jgi:error-prone DNA polymerase
VLPLRAVWREVSTYGYGQVQREGDVIHVIAKRLTDLSAMLSKLGGRSAPFPGRSVGDDGAQNGGEPGPRAGKPSPPAPRDIYIPPLHLDEINVKARNFR